MASNIGSCKELAWKRYRKGVDLQCVGCKETKPACEFNKWEVGRTKGHRCRMCMAKYARKSYMKKQKFNIERNLKYCKENIEMHRETDLINWHRRRRGILNTHARRRLYYASLSEEGKDSGQ